MSNFEQIVQANEEHARAFDRSHLPIPPARQLVILTCMDARIHPYEAFGVQAGDAHIIRNAGGRASDDAIRSIAISQRLLGTTEVIVIHHTDCGMLTFSNEDLAAKLQQDLGVDASGHDFLPFTDLEQSVRDDVETIRRSPLTPPDVRVHGAIYDVKSGRLEPVE